MEHKVVLPYVQGTSEKIAKILRKKEIRTIFQPPHTIRNFLKSMILWTLGLIKTSIVLLALVVLTILVKPGGLFKLELKNIRWLYY